MNILSISREHSNHYKETQPCSQSDISEFTRTRMHQKLASSLGFMLDKLSGPRGCALSRDDVTSRTTDKAKEKLLVVWGFTERGGRVGWQKRGTTIGIKKLYNHSNKPM